MTGDIWTGAGLTDRAVTAHGPHRIVRMRRRYATDPDDLWSAWTDPERAARWLGTLTGEPREGGTVTLELLPPAVGAATIDVLRCDPPHRLAVRWRVPGEPDALGDLRLHDAGDGGTDVVLELLPIADAVAATRGSEWEGVLSRLDAELTGRPVDTEPDTEQVATWAALLRDAGGDDRWPDVDGDTIRVRHELAAPGDAVWAAITDTAALSRWFGATTGDLRVGGSWTVTWEQGSASGTITDCAPGRRVVTTWQWAHEPQRPPSTVTVTLEPAGPERTLVTLVESGAGPAAKGYAAGWFAHLRALGNDLAGRRRVEADWDADWEQAIALLRT